MQLKIYLSSTFIDLEMHREKVYRELRSLRHDVVAMEDYVAADKRPLDQCLQDVRGADVYVGIFAWRYGYVPTEANPDRLSVTELELREAELLNKPRLIFMLKNTAPWPPSMMDAKTGENQQGARIEALRDALQQQHLVGMFETSDELAVKVVSALYRWQIESSSAATPVGAQSVTEAGSQATAREDCSLLWVTGSRLRVHFLDTPSLLHWRVLRLAQIWSAYANISFEPSEDKTAEVRVTLNEAQGTWSYEGTRCLKAGRKEPTMNISGLRADSLIDELEPAVLQVFGHVLGLAHEHNNPDAAIAWNKKMIYEQMGGPPYFWPKEMVDRRYFSTWPRNRFPFAKPFDPYSVMTWPIPPEWTEDRFSIGSNVTLSSADREFISRLYPYSDSTVSEAPNKNKPGGDSPRARE